MGLTYSLQTLRETAQALVVDENGVLATTAQWNRWINEGMRELFEFLHGSDMLFSYTEEELTTPGVTANSFNLAATHMYTRAVRVEYNGRSIPLEAMNFNDRARMDDSILDAKYGAPFATRYLPANGKLFLFPEPPSGQVYHHLYIPEPTDLAADIDTFNVQVPSGERIIVLHAAIQGRIRERSGTGDLQEERARVEAKILSQRDKLRPPVTVPRQVEDIEHAADRRPYRRPW